MPIIDWIRSKRTVIKVENQYYMISVFRNRCGRCQFYNSYSPSVNAKFNPTCMMFNKSYNTGQFKWPNRLQACLDAEAEAAKE